MMNKKAILTFVLVLLGMLVGVGLLLSQFGASTDAPIADIAGDKHHAQGSGLVTLVEFSDFQCPACQAVEVPLEQMLAKYSGKVEFVYRYFPLTTIHKNAQISAQAAEAAGHQNKFWEMHALLFAKQSEWEGIADPKEIFLGYVRSLSMDEAQFLADLDSQSIKDAVATDVIAATKYNLNGTPTFFVNGVKTDFGQIESKLAELTK